MGPLRGLRAAAGFLTRIPVGEVASDDMGPAINWFPFVGALIGAVAGCVFVVLSKVVPVSVAAVVALSVEWLITGAFHLDGLADMADGFGGGWNVEQRLEIMKDSRHGTYGVVSLVAVMSMQILALGTLGPAQGFVGIIAANTLGRMAAVVVMMLMRPARVDGLGVSYRTGLSTTGALIGVGFGAIIVAGLSGWWSLAFAAAAVTSAGAVAWLSHRKIGGIAGDVLGAIEQIAATAVLVVASGAAAHASWPWWT
jgi:adenosylcobinamide-GDP ribazoletransferase